MSTVVIIPTTLSMDYINNNNNITQIKRISLPKINMRSTEPILLEKMTSKMMMKMLSESMRAVRVKSRRKMSFRFSLVILVV